MVIAARLIMLACDIIFGLLCARALCTWLFQFGWGWVDTIYRVSCGLTEFLVGPCRKLTSRINTGMFDISLLLACIVLIVARDILLRIIMMF